MTNDEKACMKANKEYMSAVRKYKLDNIEDGWGQDKKRYMSDSFIAGFYTGRDYQKDKAFDNLEKFTEILIKKIKQIPDCVILNKKDIK